MYGAAMPVSECLRTIQEVHLSVVGVNPRQKPVLLTKVHRKINVIKKVGVHLQLKWAYPDSPSAGSLPSLARLAEHLKQGRQGVRQGLLVLPRKQDLAEGIRVHDPVAVGTRRDTLLLRVPIETPAEHRCQNLIIKKVALVIRMFLIHHPLKRVSLKLQVLPFQVVP
jgi:hypothetical protein